MCDNNGLCIIAGCGQKVRNENPLEVFCEKHMLEAMGFPIQDMTAPTGMKFKIRHIYKWPWIIRKIYEFFHGSER